jgi:phospholipase/carboxylesterase
MAHGRSDPVIPYVLGKKSAEELAGLGYALAWHEYAMPHSVCMEEVRDIETWLRQRLRADTVKGG